MAERTRAVINTALNPKITSASHTMMEWSQEVGLLVEHEGQKSTVVQTAGIEDYLGAAGLTQEHACLTDTGDSHCQFRPSCCTFPDEDIEGGWRYPDGASSGLSVPERWPGPGAERDDLARGQPTRLASGVAATLMATPP